MKNKRKTPNVTGSEQEVLTKNGRRLLKAQCTVCGKTKARFLPSKKKITGDGVAETTLDLFLRQGVSYLAKKGVEAGRYYASEALRNPNLQKKDWNYGLKKLTPIAEKVGHELLDQVSTKVRPNLRYKTDRPDLDGHGVVKDGGFPLANFRQLWEFATAADVETPTDEEKLC